jgi:IS30 family transposase
MSTGHLTESERTVIFYLQMERFPKAQIARRLGRSPSTIGRELNRNSNLLGQYLPDHAHRLALRRRQQPRLRLKSGSRELMGYVAAALEKRWSPDQIAGRLDARPPAHLAGQSISHTTIYRWIWGDPQRSERFKPFLRVACKPRRKPYGKPTNRGLIPNRVSIDDRPGIVDLRSRLGDWEGDSVVGRGRSGYVLTGVERRSRLLVAGKLPRATATDVNDTLVRLLGRMPPTRRRTFTVDNGKEFAGHQELTRRLKLAVYFAHPYSSWERGTNENTNGLLRQYLPKKRSFETLTETELQVYVKALNHRPRKCLNYQTPAEVFHKTSALHLRC